MDKKRILLIEDEVKLSDMMKTRLEANDYEVETAYDGEEGLEKVRKVKPDLILLDIVMPKMNGYEVSRCLKSSEETSKIPIIIITASGAKDLEEKCRKVGVNIFMQKPYESAELLAKIKEALS